MVAYDVGNVSAIDARFHARIPAALACSLAILPLKPDWESVLLITTGKLCTHFLRSASERFSFSDSITRMQCDHNAMTRRKRLNLNCYIA